jgi:hypothetical protein
VPPGITDVILAGLAGGLDPELRVGDVVLHAIKSGSSVPPIAGVKFGRIHTAAAAVCTPAEKAALYVKTGALAVDMEGDAVRRWANEAHLRFFHLRAISDAADQSIAPAVLGLIDPMGNPIPAKVAAYLVRNPLRIRELRTLQANSKLALTRLSEALIELLRHLND